MVSQGAAQATRELATVLARVPPEMWVAIARAGPGEMAFAMERVCQSWRCALVAAGDALWKPLTLARFPRIAGILRASLTDPPPYREMYRDQAKAEAAAQEKEAASVNAGYLEAKVAEQQAAISIQKSFRRSSISPTRKQAPETEQERQELENERRRLAEDRQRAPRHQLPIPH